MSTGGANALQVHLFGMIRKDWQLTMAPVERWACKIEVAIRQIDDGVLAIALNQVVAGSHDAAAFFFRCFVCSFHEQLRGSSACLKLPVRVVGEGIAKMSLLAPARCRCTTGSLCCCRWSSGAAAPRRRSSASRPVRPCSPSAACCPGRSRTSISRLRSGWHWRHSLGPVRPPTCSGSARRSRKPWCLPSLHPIDRGCCSTSRS